MASLVHATKSATPAAAVSALPGSADSTVLPFVCRRPRLRTLCGNASHPSGPRGTNASRIFGDNCNFQIRLQHLPAFFFQPQVLRLSARGSGRHKQPLNAGCFFFANSSRRFCVYIIKSEIKAAVYGAKTSWRRPCCGGGGGGGIAHATGRRTRLQHPEDR
jgi:hypothetical protein